MPRTGLVLDDCFKRHLTGPGHPERAERLDAVRRDLTEAGLVERCRLIEPSAIAMDRLLANHAESYIQRLKQHCAAGEQHIDCVDSVICPETYDIALLAAGAVVAAADAVATGELKNAFCAVRPPGHHAERDMSMGFCMFNNVALAARQLLDAHGVERVLILDWDVHHGNGTQHTFEDDPRVFFCSFHGHPSAVYPGTGYAEERGRGAGEGTTLNIPMMPQCGDGEYRSAYEEQFLPAARAFAPEFVLISAGFDAHRDDPLAPINLETQSYAWLTRRTLALAEEFCDGRLVSVLEGGYDLKALGESVAAHLQELLCV